MHQLRRFLWLEELSSPVVQPHIHPPEHEQGTYSGRHLHLLENILIVWNRRHLEQSIRHSHRQWLKEDFIIHLSAIGLLQRYHFFKYYFPNFCQLSIVFDFSWGDGVSPKRNPKQWLCKSLDGQQRVIYNNYSPKWRWLVVQRKIYRGAKGRDKYPPLATDTAVNNCFSIY